jgi:hypothetical protein
MTKYKVIGMLRSGLDKDLNDARTATPVPYLLESQRGPYRVTVTGGLLYQNGNLLDTSHISNGLYLFVMDGDGRIFSAAQTTVDHHSAFLAGNPVAAAGEIEVDQGKLLAVYDQSGHYMPPREYTEQFLKELKSLGVDLTGITLDFKGIKKKQRIANMKKADKTNQRLYPEGPKEKRY